MPQVYRPEQPHPDPRQSHLEFERKMKGMCSARGETTQIEFGFVLLAARL
jgi:hypothetical protein